MIDVNAILDEADKLISAFMYDQAIAKYDFILENVSDCADALLMRGALLGTKGMVDRAIADIEKAIDYDSENDSSYATLAYLYQRKNNDKKAIELCRVSIQLNPDNSEALKLFTQLSMKLGEERLVQSIFDEAEMYFKSVIEVAGENASLLYKLVLVLRGKGAILDSIEMAERVIAKDSGHIRAKTHIASSYELLGEIEKGNQLIASLKCDHPDHPMVNIVYAQYSLRNKTQQSGISALEELLKNKDLLLDDRVSAGILLGDLYDSIESYDEAFKFYKEANDFLNKNYDAESYRVYLSSLIDYFSKENYSSLPVSDNCSDELIFIVGMPRSGTSLIEQIVSSHPAVFGAGELPNVNVMVNSLKETMNLKNEFPLCLDELETGSLNKLAENLIIESRINAVDSQKIIDKMPHNYIYIGLLHKLLPNAKFINCERDPRDTCLSIYFKNFTGYHPYSSDFHNLAKHYKAYQDLMNHWINELNIPVYTVKYENVVTDPENEIRNMLNFIGLEWSDECLNFHNRKRVSATASYNQVNKKIYTSSVGRWKNYENNIAELLNELGY